MIAVYDYHDLAIKLWDVPSRSLIGNLPVRAGGHRNLTISPDGKLLASGGEDQTVRLWDLSNHEETSYPNAPGHYSITFSSDMGY